MMFLGEYQVAFTGQGRVLLPKKIRDLLADSEFVLMRGEGTCLAGYKKENFEALSQSMLAESLKDTQTLQERRKLFSATVYAEVDDQGRFVIPKSMLTYAHLNKKVLIVGVGDHFEIWGEEAWNKANS